MVSKIRSFVTRKGRLSPRQEHGLNVLFPFYALNETTLWDFSHIFERTAPTFVEIGFGMGTSLFDMATRYPEYNFIGIEVHQAGIGSLSASLKAANVTNVRIAKGDATEMFKVCIPQNTLDGVFILFPDPWPKKRHNKRRMIQSDFLKVVSNTLKFQGILHCATDWSPYAEHIETVFREHEAFQLSDHETLVKRNHPLRSLTKFEARGQALGHTIHDMIYVKEKLA